MVRADAGAARRSARLVRAAHAVPVGGVADRRAGAGLFAAADAAQLTDRSRPTGAVHVDLLADERRAATVGAARAVGLEGADAAPEQQQLELLTIGGDVGHGGLGIRPRAAPILPRSGSATAFAAPRPRVARHAERFDPQPAGAIVVSVVLRD